MNDLSSYILPEGNVQIAFSGGRSSAYMLHQILEANGDLPDRAVVTFQNTGCEMPETPDFVAEVGERWNVPIRWLEYRPSRASRHPFDVPRFAEAYRQIFGVDRFDTMSEWLSSRATDDRFEIVSHNLASRLGEPFEALMMARQYLPNVMSRFCTIEMKVRTAKRYLRSLGWEHWTNAVGFRADEEGRVNKPAPRDRWTVWAPMYHARATRRTVSDFWRQQPFDLRLPNVGGSCWLGNCHGCFLKSEANVAALAREYPDLALWWERWEAWITAIWPMLSRFQRLRRIIRANPNLVASLRDGYRRPLPASVITMIVDRPQSASQFSKRYSRRELREFVERHGDLLLSNEGLLCQADDGECVA